MKIEMTEQEWSNIIQMLSEYPYKNVANILAKMNNQLAQKQNNNRPSDEEDV